MPYYIKFGCAESINWLVTTDHFRKSLVILKIEFVLKTRQKHFRIKTFLICSLSSNRVFPVGRKAGENGTDAQIKYKLSHLYLLSHCMFYKL